MYNSCWSRQILNDYYFCFFRWGETFDISKHPQGTEVKAITYSNMQIHEDNEKGCDVFVIIDI